MACKVLCPSLPDLLRKTILTFCEGSVKFEHFLEVTGSLHIRSDNEKVTTFLLDELVSRAADEDVQCIDLSKPTLNHEDSKQAYESEDSAISKPNDPNSMPKKSRKLKRPVRKLTYDYNENYESSGGESDFEYAVVDQNQNETERKSPPHQFERVQRRLRDSLDNTDSNTSASSEEVARIRCVAKRADQVVSPYGPAAWEVTSTRPDDSPPCESRNLPEASMPLDPEFMPVQDAPCDLRREATPAERNDTTVTVAEASSLEASVGVERPASSQDPYQQLLEHMALARQLSPALSTMFQPLALQPLDVASLAWPPHLTAPKEEDRPTQPQNGLDPDCPAWPSYFSPAGPVKTEAMRDDGSETWDRQISCAECGKVLKSPKMLQIHMNTAHTHKTVYPCKQCGKLFYAASSLHSHRKRTHTSWEQKLKCTVCPRTFAFQSELLRHLDTAHNVSQYNVAPTAPFPSLPAPPPPVIISPCPPAVEPPPPPPTTTQPADTSPQNAASPPEITAPEKVEEDSYSKANKSSPVLVQSSEGMRYKCPECGMLLKSKECLALHINAKHTQKHAYPCHFCGRVFYAPSSRFCHVRRVHTSSEQKFKCLYCWKVFTFHYELRNHMKMMHRSKMSSRGNLAGDAVAEDETAMEIESSDSKPLAAANWGTLAVWGGAWWGHPCHSYGQGR